MISFSLARLASVQSCFNSRLGDVQRGLRLDLGLSRNSRITNTIKTNCKRNNFKNRAFVRDKDRKIETRRIWRFGCTQWSKRTKLDFSREDAISRAAHEVGGRILWDPYGSRGVEWSRFFGNVVRGPKAYGAARSSILDTPASRYFLGELQSRI